MSIFTVGRLFGGLLGHFKMLMILVAIITVISYLQATRLDAKKAAAASVEIDQLVRINRIKDQQMQIQVNLTAEYQRQSAENLSIIANSQSDANVEIKRIDEIKEEGDGQWCKIDCRVP